MSVRDRIMIAYVGLFVLLLLLAGVSLSLTTSFEETIVGADSTNARVISNAGRLYVLLPRINGSALFQDDKTPQGLADFESDLREADRRVADLVMTLETDGSLELAGTLSRGWENQRRGILSIIDIEDLAEREQRFIAEIRPASDRIRGVLASAMEDSFSDIRQGTQRVGDRVRNVKVLLLTITFLGIVMCVGFLAALGNLLKKPAHELVRMIDSITTSRTLHTPKASLVEVGAVVSALERLMVHIRATRRSDLLMLSQVERRAEHALDCIPDALAVLDKSGTVLYCNKTLVGLLGKPPKTFHDFPWPRVFKMIEDCMDSAIPQVSADMGKAIQLFLDGAEKFYIPGAYPLKSEAGAVEEMVILLNDVSYIKRLDEMKTDLVAAVSHQLKTPLTSIRMSLHLLMANTSETFSERDLELVSTALDESDRLQSTIDGLIEMARIQSGSIEMNFEPTETSSWVKEVGNSYQAKLAEAGIEFSIDVEPELPMVHLDKQRMASVLDNLISNTAEHCRSGDKVEMRAMAERANSAVVGVSIAVSDTGPGIDSSEVARVFERFYRGPTASVPGPKKPGSGLGLAIARRIVQAHGGEMSCRSVVGEGTTFVVTVYSGVP